MEGKTLSLDTDYAGTLEIHRERIEKLTSDEPLEIHFVGGEIVRGTIGRDAAGAMQLRTPLLNTATSLFMDRVAAINPPSKKATWSGNIMLGANLESGNSDKNGFSVGLNALRKAERHRFEVGFLYNYAKEEGALSTKNMYGKTKYDYFVTPKFYTYLSNELLYDAFKDLQLRTVVGPGTGYQLWDDEITSLAFEAGVAYFNEDHKKGNDNSWTTGRLAANLRYNFSQKVIFTEQIILYPSMGTFGEFTLRNEAAISSPLAFGWALRLTSIIEHDSDPEPGIKKTDYDLLLGLQYGF